MTSGDPFGISDSVVDGRYRVERVVGQGGFGVVYRAQHLGFESPIALKVLKLPEEWSPARREARLASFQREGRMLFELSHLHASIVRAFETGTIRGRDGSLAPYLALEWLEGASLDRELRSRRALGAPPLSLADALAVLSGPAQGLARAHAKGIAHRDIKPGNLFISTRDGEQSVKILDFGIAKLVDASFDRSEPLSATTTTTASFTPLYAAPEQWVDTLGATGTWTDVHALALVAVELMTGRAPFAGSEPGELMAACLASVRPTPGACGVALPRPVEEVFARALALEPRARFSHAGAFWAALCAAAAWRDGDGARVLELTARRPGDGEASSYARVAGQQSGPTATTVATAPPTTRNRASVSATGSRLARSGAAAVALVVAAGVVAYGVAGRVRSGFEAARPTGVSAAVRPAAGAAPVLHPANDARPAGPPPRAASLAKVGETAAPTQPSAQASAKRTAAKGPTGAVAHGPAHPPAVAANASDAPVVPVGPIVPPAKPQPVAIPSPDPPTASFALPAAQSPRRSNGRVDINDPGLKRRK